MYKNEVPLEAGKSVYHLPSKMIVLFRPVNVPRKNKWLRESVASIGKAELNIDGLFLRVASDLNFTKQICLSVGKIRQRAEKKTFKF